VCIGVCVCNVKTNHHVAVGATTLTQHTDTQPTQLELKSSIFFLKPKHKPKTRQKITELLWELLECVWVCVGVGFCFCEGNYSNFNRILYFCVHHRVAVGARHAGWESVCNF